MAKQILPYTTAFRVGPEMFRSLVDQTVFGYLWDEYVCRVRTGKPLTFHVSVSLVSFHRNINRTTVYRSLKSLRRMGVIDLDDSCMCTVKASYYISLLYTLNDIKSSARKNEFLDAVENHDMEKLEGFGYIMVQAIEELSQMSGFTPIIPENDAENGKVLQKTTDVAENNRCCRKQQMLQKATGVLQKTTHTVAENNTVNNIIKNNACAHVNQKSEAFPKKIKKGFSLGEEQEGEETFQVYFQLDRKSRFVPYLSEEEVDSAINNPSSCLDRGDLLFINCLWEVLKEFTDRCIELDESGNTGVVVDDPDGVMLEAPFIDRNILVPAYEAMEEILQTRSFKYKGADLEIPEDVTFTPEDLSELIDWQTVTDDDGMECYVVDKSRFVDLKAAREEKKPGRRFGLEGREEDKRYMNEIVRLGSGDDTFNKLTNIELVAYNFLVSNFQFSNDGKVLEPNDSYINRQELSKFYITALESGVTEDDFLSILFRNHPDTTDGSLRLKARMFSSAKIMEWNKKHGQISTIS